LFVTHDVDEALLLSDRVIVLSPRPGRILADITVPFARDRRTADLKLDSDFVQLKRQVMGLLRHKTEHASALESLNGR
jgi:NitT/TauT family transport system ATP-binding protein